MLARTTILVCSKPTKAARTTVCSKPTDAARTTVCSKPTDAARWREKFGGPHHSQSLHIVLRRVNVHQKDHLKQNKHLNV